MGRKKKFIDKKESTTFHVVHRSQQDKANEGEQEASEFVLVPSAPPRDNRPPGHEGARGKGDRGKESLTEAKRDHINALGLPNDGYDYNKHLKSMGGGTFVSRSGKVQHFAESNSHGARGGRTAKATIPEEALPSEETLDRQLEAVTISEKVMDGDMRRALAVGLGDRDEEEHWEEDANMLDDDFVMQAAGAGEDEGFDFDAHVARLMEASAKETGLRQRTADDNLQTKGLARLRRDSDSESDGGVPDLDGAQSDDSGEIDEALLEGLAINGGEGGEGGEGGIPGEGTEERALLDSQFEGTLAAYDSDEWGELEEDDDRVQGQWDVEQHEYANTCMDDFLATNEDARWTEGVERLPPEQRAIAAASLAVEDAAGGRREGGPGDSQPESGSSATAARGGEVANDLPGESAVKTSGPRLGKLRGLAGFQAEDEDEDELHDIEHHNEYLRAKPVEQWDCETIVSTYSNLDNHPSVLGMGRKAKPRRPRPSSATAAEGVIEGNAENASPVKQVTLSAKTGLPLGVLPERTFDDTGMVSLVVGKNAGEKRDTQESKEEKKLRKAQIKQSKREKRAQKKSVKVAFTTEAKVISHALANPEAPQNRSVFSYS